MPLTKDRLQKAYDRWNGILWALLALGLILYTLYGGREIGLSNNGDFGRVMGASSLEWRDVSPTRTYVGEYRIQLPYNSAAQNVGHILFGPQGLDTYPSLHVAVVRVTVVMNLVLNKLTGAPIDLYRLSVLGTLYTLLYAGAIGFVCSRFRLKTFLRDAVAKAAALLVLCDIGYTAYFNSFYGEPLEHILLVWCLGLLAHALLRKPSPWACVPCALAAVGYGWAKFFNIPLAILAAVVMEGALYLRTKDKRVWAGLGGAVLVLFWAWSLVPSWMSIETSYNALSLGITREVDESTAAGYLRDMGLPEELAVFRDTSWYTQGVRDRLREEGLMDAASSITSGDLIRFYLTHPSRLFYQLDVTAQHSAMLRPYYLANHGAPWPDMSFSTRLSLWSTLRQALPFDALWVNILLPIGFALLVFWRWGKPALLPLAVLLGGLCYAFILPVVLNGHGDLAKHMFAYAELLDLMLLTSLTLALQPGEKRWPVQLTAAGMAALLLVPTVCGGIKEFVQARTPHDGLEAGAHVTLGTWQGEPLVWLVTGREEEGWSLFCVNGMESRPFDEDGENRWEDADVRSWLNGAFLEAFTAEEQALLVPMTHSPVLPDAYADTATQGELPMTYLHRPRLADLGYARAYRRQVRDVAALPDVGLIARMARAGLPVAGDYWLETPYGPAGDVGRRMTGEGIIVLAPADGTAPLCPVVLLGDSTQPVAGRGTAGNPFRLQP